VPFSTWHRYGSIHGFCVQLTPKISSDGTLSDTGER